MKTGLVSISLRIRRWVIALQDFCFEVEYIPGPKNVLADFLTRFINDTDLEEVMNKFLEEEVNVFEVTLEITTVEWKEEMVNDL